MTAAPRIPERSRRARARGRAIGAAIGVYLGLSWGLLRAWLGPATGAAVWDGAPTLLLMYWLLRRDEMPRALAFCFATMFAALSAGIMWLFQH